MKVLKPTNAEIAKTTTWDIWECEPSTFSWHYDQKEVCYILEGDIEVEDLHGNIISFGPGDWVEFEAGLSCTWRVKEHIRKHYCFE